MGMNAFLTLPGIKGSARQKHVEGKIVVSGMTHEVNADIEIDINTGLLKTGLTGNIIAGKPKHKPLVVVKDLDRSSPKLHGAMNSSEKFATAQIDFWRMPPYGGKEERHYSIILTGATIIGIKTIMQNNKKQEFNLFPEQEEVSFLFDKISYAWASGGNEGGASGMNASELENYGPVDSVFEPAAAAKLKAMALDVAKDAAKGIGGAIFTAIKGELKPETPK